MTSKFKNSKKGNEKTIEIFVALFLILAVAMVLLKMFSGQVADKSNELNRVNEVQASTGKCGDLCSKARTNNCRLEDQIAFCVSTYKLDLNIDNEIGEYDKGAYTLCEDNIYCPLEYKCVCGNELSMEKCLEITKDYYKSLGISNISKIFESKYRYTNGACKPPQEGDQTWRSLFANKFNFNDTSSS